GFGGRGCAHPGRRRRRIGARRVPAARRACAAVLRGGCDLGGLMIWYEGDFGEFDETLRAAVACHCEWTTAQRFSSSACSELTSTCSRRPSVDGDPVAGHGGQFHPSLDGYPTP